MNSRDDDPEALVQHVPSEPLARRDPEVPEADALDQSRDVVPRERRGSLSRGIDVPEADAVGQAIEEPLDLEDDLPANPRDDENAT